MNRNSETYFSSVPTVEMQRSTFDLSHESLTTFNVGDLTPLCAPIEVYPGDTFEIATSKVVRLQTLMHPIFGALYFDVYWFFVPNRLVHDNWPGVMGENLTGAWAPSVEYSTPLIQLDFSTDEETKSVDLSEYGYGTVIDHYGIPHVDGLRVNALPIRGYHLIWNEYFRDQNLQDPLNIYTGDATKYTQTVSALEETYLPLRKAGRLHDYFSSALPAPQKALNPVNIPISGSLPVVTTTDYHNQDTPVALAYDFLDSSTAVRYLHKASDTNAVELITSPALALNSYPINLWAELIPGVGNDAQGLVATIDDLRTAFAIQRMLERDCFGSRYRELILAHFSVATGDARMQVPEYLGGNRITLNISQVVNSAESETAQLGNLGAFSHTVDVHGDFVKSFVEHGFIHCLGVVRYPNVYAQGLQRLWSRSGRYSYYWPSLAFIGAQAIANKEIFAQGNAEDDGVFGYQEAWADLRMIPNQVSGLFRPYVDGSLDSWTLSDDYDTLPTLSAGWIESNHEIVDRALAVTSQLSDQILGDFWFDVKATRVLPMFSMPGLVDHF